MNKLADRVFAGRRQREAELVRLLGEELVRDLHQDAGAVAGARIGADRAAMLEIAQDRERVLDDLVRLAALDVGDEADAAGILVERRIVEPLRGRQTGIGAVGKRRQPDASFARRRCVRSSSSPGPLLVSPSLPARHVPRRAGAIHLRHHPSRRSAPWPQGANRRSWVMGGLVARRLAQARGRSCSARGDAHAHRS